jgi:hypothetical protein
VTYLAGDDEPTGEVRLPVPLADPNIIALGDALERMVAPVARAEAERAVQETEQLRIFLDHDWRKHLTYGAGVLALLGVAVGAWSAGEITGAAILTHFGAVITGFAAGRQGKPE